MTSFADLVHARWRVLAAPDDPAERICCRHLPAGRLQWSLHRSLGGLDAGRPEA
jgi:hypothetical protein